MLPKPIRDRMGLRAGSEVAVEETAEGLTLKVPKQSALKKIDGFWVYTGEIPAGWEILRAIEEDREERSRKAWGL